MMLLGVLRLPHHVLQEVLKTLEGMANSSKPGRQVYACSEHLQQQDMEKQSDGGISKT